MKKPKRERPATRFDQAKVEALYTLLAVDEEVTAYFNVYRKTVLRAKANSPAFRAAAERGQAFGHIALRAAMFPMLARGGHQGAVAGIFLAKVFWGYSCPLPPHWPALRPRAATTRRRRAGGATRSGQPRGTR
jgi:hypothetical protein